MHYETGRDDSPCADMKVAERRVIGQELGCRKSGFPWASLFPYPVSHILLAPCLPSPPCWSFVIGISIPIEANGFLRNIPLCGYLADAMHMLIETLQEDTAELLCGTRANSEEEAEATQLWYRAVTLLHSPSLPRQTLPHDSLLVTTSTLTLYLLNLR